MAFAVVASAASASASSPNFVFILIDDMGYGDLSCYGGVKDATPQIDALAREGLRFSQFYVGAPICSPSRVAFTTGQHPARWNITSFLASRRENERRGIANWLDPKAPSLARELKKAGYVTGHFGKWHMGGQRDVAEAPLITEYGFDESLTQFEGLGDRILPLLDAFDGKEPRKYALGSDELGRGEITWMDRSKVTSAFVSRTMEFMRKAQAEGKPFYVNLWPDDVHSPFFPPKHLRGDSSKRDLYLGVLKAMDEQFAPLFSYLRSTPALLTNTLVLVTSDNGPEPGAGSAGPFRGHKGMLYEGGMREPLIVWGPGFLPKSTRGKWNNKTVISAFDLLPSICRLAGVAPPPGIKLDGEDLSSALLGKSDKSRSSALFWNRPPDRPGNAEAWPDLAMRSADWKLLISQDGSNPRLYNLKSDPGETKNLSDQHKTRVAELRPQLLQWWKSMPASASGLDVRRNGTPSDALRYFMNPIAEGADPWITRLGKDYLLVQSEGNRGVALYRSDRLTAMGPKRVIWQAPEQGPCSREVWAPEIHFLDDRWYVYVAASDGHNRNHRMWALQSEGTDPFGKYTLHGPMYTGDDPDTGVHNRWAIDGTVLEHEGKRFFIWSGWEAEADEQWLYIAQMKDTLTLGKRVRICDNDDYLWERVAEKADQRGLHEAPQVLKRNGRTFVVYSCSSSWQPTYKLGLLELRAGGDPLNPRDWKKYSEPVFRPNDTTYGAAHNCFVQSPDGKEDWLVYHAKVDRRDGWRRGIYAQPFTWKDSGLPDFGGPVAGKSMLPVPSGEFKDRTSPILRLTLKGEAALEPFSYYGHHQFIQTSEQGLCLGAVPSEPINDYRCGEKVLLKDELWRDFFCSVQINVQKGGRDAGILFRCTLPGIGYDSQYSYFAGIIPSSRKVVLGSTDGDAWRELALVDADLQEGHDHLLSITAIGSEIVVSLDGKEIIRRRDGQHMAGSVGLRVVDTHAVFSNLTVQPITPSVQLN